MPGDRSASRRSATALGAEPLVLLQKRLERANQVMRAANAALIRNDEQALLQLGFSPEHIADLRQQGGFQPSVLKANRQTFTYLGRCLNAKAS
jgi:hypothetical protein